MADDEPLGEDQTPVSLFACYGKVYVWDADEVFRIRSTYRIVGSLIGSLPRKQRQNSVCSLPLLLSQEEVTLLLDKGFAKIFDVPQTFPTPSNKEVEEFNELRRESIVKQIEQLTKMQEEKRLELAEVIEEGRRRKRRKAGDDDAAKANEEVNSECDKDGELKVEKNCSQLDAVCNENDNVKGHESKRKYTAADDEKESVVTKKMKSEGLHSESAADGEGREEEKNCNQLNVNCNMNSDISVTGNKEETCSENITFQANKMNPPSNTVAQESQNKLVEKPEVPVLSTNSEMNIEEGKSYSELGTLIHIPTVMPQRLQSWPSADWTYPQTRTEKLRYRVFSDLWEKGYYLTSGVNFGGDFLAYPGDPMRYHSFYIVIIIPWRKRITPFDMISAGRLGASVKKTALLCSVSDDTDEVLYTSVKWSGIS